MGVGSPDVFGPPVWDFAHIAAYCMPDNPTTERLQGFAQYMHSLKHIIPCDICRDHHTKAMDQHPPENIQSGADAMRYVNDRHNDVNRRLGKKEFSLEDSKNRIKNMLRHGRESSYGTSYIFTLVIIVISIIVSFLLGNQMQKISFHSMPKFKSF